MISYEFPVHWVISLDRVWLGHEHTKTAHANENVHWFLKGAPKKGNKEMGRLLYTLRC